MRLSVVILNYNVRWFLQLCLESVTKAISGIDAEIIVVDNHSPDDSCDMVKSLFPDVRLIENKTNAGFPKGNNLGVSAAKGEYICILNPDTVVAEDTFLNILEFADSRENLGIIGCKLIDGTGNFLPESKRGIPTPFNAFGRVSGLFKIAPSIFGKYYARHLKPDETGKVEILVGAFMVMKRDVYWAAGGFDENCFMYSDDIDLSYTVLKSGRENWYFAGTTVVHFKGESTVRDGLYMKRFRDAMNFFYKKHFRISPVFDIFMKAGAFAFSLKKQSDAVKTRLRTDVFAFVPAEGFTMAKAHKLLGKIAGQAENPGQKKVNSSNVQVWLDARRLGFKNVISEMEQRRGAGKTFRIVLENVAIGSDSSNDRGEVLRF